MEIQQLKSPTHICAVLRFIGLCLPSCWTTLCLSLLLLPMGIVHATSAFLGGLACAIPNAYLVWKAFRYRGASAAQKIARSFYQGEAGKFALTVLAFVLIFTLVKTD